MKLFYSLCVIFVLFSCSSSSDDATPPTDDTTGGTDDSTDDSTDDGSGVDVTIDYDVAALNLFSGAGIIYTKIENGVTVGSSVNLSTELGLTVSEEIAMDAPFLIFHRTFFVSDPVFFYNTETGTMDAVTDYFTTTGDEAFLGIRVTGSKIVVFYFLNSEVDTDNGWPVYARIFDRSSGSSQDVTLAADFIVRDGTAADDNFGVLHYTTIGLEDKAAVFNLSSADLLTTYDMEDPDTPQGKSFSLDGPVFVQTRFNAQTLQTFNLSTGAESSVLNTDSFVGDIGEYFRAKVGAEQIMFKMPFASSSPFSDLPAQVLLETGRVTSLNPSLLAERGLAFISDLAFLTGYDLEADTGIVIFGLSRGPDGDQGGLIFTTVASDIVQTVETDLKYDRVFVIE